MGLGASQEEKTTEVKKKQTHQSFDENTVNHILGQAYDHVMSQYRKTDQELFEEAIDFASDHGAIAMLSRSPLVDWLFHSIHKGWRPFSNKVSFVRAMRPITVLASPEDRLQLSLDALCKGKDHIDRQEWENFVMQTWKNLFSWVESKESGISQKLLQEFGKGVEDSLSNSLEVMFRDADHDKDGVLSQQELAYWMMQSSDLYFQYSGNFVGASFSLLTTSERKAWIQNRL